MDDEDYALQSTGTILGRERGAHVVHAKLTQPRRCGGFGVRHTNHLEGQAAYLSAAATAHCAMEARPAPFQPFEGPMVALLSQQWEALHDQWQMGSGRRSSAPQMRPTCPSLHGRSTPSVHAWHRIALTCFWNLLMRPPWPARRPSLTSAAAPAMAYGPAHGASVGAEACRVLRRHAAPTGHVAAALQHGWHPLLVRGSPFG
jgi:hypothetical protein